MTYLKQYRGVIFHNTEGWFKMCRKTDLWFGKLLEEYGKFSPEHLEVSKRGFWWNILIQSRKRITLKPTEELCVMTMKNDAKFEKELTCYFNIDMRNLKEFWSEQLNVSKIFILMCSKIGKRNLSNFYLSTKKFQKVSL